MSMDVLTYLAIGVGVVTGVLLLDLLLRVLTNRFAGQQESYKPWLGNPTARAGS